MDGILLAKWLPTGYLWLADRNKTNLGTIIKGCICKGSEIFLQY